MGIRTNNPMAVVPFTISISLMLVTTFIAFFLIERRRARQSSSEHDSLLPLADEQPRVVLPRPEWPDA